jgi:hypothetical protein
MSKTFISFEPIEWTQEIMDYPSINVAGRYLRVICRATANCHVRLNDAIDLRDFTIPLGIRDRNSKADERLSKEALGGIWYIADQNFVHGWFCLKEPEWFTAVWDQVRDGNYSECNITLSIGPVESEGYETWIWTTNHPLSIDSVAIQFNRKTPSNQAKPRRSLFDRLLAR